MTLSSSEYDRLLTGIKGLDGRMLKLEEQRGASGEVILLKLDHLADEIADVKAGVEKINSRVGKAENGQQDHETRVALLEAAWRDQIKPSLLFITDNRIRIAAGGLGLGGGIGAAIILIGKVAGWW